MIRSLDEAGRLPVELVGGKGRGLARLAALDLPVPPAVVLDADVFAAYRAQGAVPDEVRQAAPALLQTLGAPLAVRSSAADEDVGDKSAAGQYESVMDVRSVDGLIAAVERCYRAADSERAVAYRGHEPTRLALVVQREVPPQRSGVAFSADPVSGRRDAILVEAVFGHGEGIVSGEISPDRYRVSREGGRVSARRADKRIAVDGRGGETALGAERRVARVLRDDDAREVATLTIAAEDGFDTPVDVEFCWLGQTLWLVQCRPITTLHAAA